MRWLTARKEFVRIDDPAIVGFAEAMIACRHPDGKVWNGTPSEFRKRHDRLVGHFGIPAKDGLGLTPAFHRGGSATHFFSEEEDIHWVRWRGRWQSQRALEIYVQEVPCLTVLQTMTVEQRNRIRLFARAASSLLKEAVANLVHFARPPRQIA